MNRLYKCVVCKGIFETVQTEQELEDQLNNEFPGYIKEECDQVCDDCYKMMEQSGVFENE